MALQSPCPEFTPTTEAELAVLRRARLIEPYRATRNTEFNAFIDRTCSTVLALYERKRDPDKLRMHVEVLLTNLFTAWCNDQTSPAIIYSRRKPDYDGTKLSYLITIERVIPALESPQLGLIRNHCGVWGEMSARLIATEKLIDFFRVLGCDPRIVEISNDFPTIRLRGEKRKEKRKDGTFKKVAPRVSLSKVPKLHRAVEYYERELAPINDRIDRTFVGLLVDDAALRDTDTCREITDVADGLEESRKFRVLPDFMRKRLYRVFNNVTAETETLHQGGRLCGGWWQWIPANLRRRIWISDAPASEIDFKSMEVSLAYAAKGLDLSVFYKDAYQLPDVPETPEERDLSKSILLTMLNCDDRWEALGAITHDPDTAHLGQAEIERRMQGFQKMHGSNIRIYGKIEGMERMFCESKIALAILTNLTGRGIPCLPVHDSFLIPNWASEQATAAMLSEFKAVTGIVPRVEAKVSLLDATLTPKTADPEKHSIFFRWLHAHEEKYGSVHDRETSPLLDVLSP